MHGRHGRDSLCPRDAADMSAGQAIASGAERGTRDDHIGSEPAQRRGDGREGLILPLAHEVVAADEGGHDLRGIAQRLLERAPRAHPAIARGHADMRLVLAADPGKELIDVMDDSERCTHECSPCWDRREWTARLYGSGRQGSRARAAIPRVAPLRYTIVHLADR